jgi:hypothetical protein
MVVELMRSYPEIPHRIHKLTADLEVFIKARLNADGCLRASIISEPTGGGQPSDPVYDNTVRLFDTFENICLSLTNISYSIRQEIEELIRKKQLIDSIISRLIDEGHLQENRFIELRYFWKWPKWRICKEMAYSRTNLFYLEKKTITLLEKFIKG